MRIVQRDPFHGRRIGRCDFQPGHPLAVGSNQLDGRDRRRLLPLRRLRTSRPLAHRPHRLYGRKRSNIHASRRGRMLQPVATTGECDRMPGDRRKKHREPQPDPSQGGTGLNGHRRFAIGGIHCRTCRRRDRAQVERQSIAELFKISILFGFPRRISRGDLLGCASRHGDANWDPQTNFIVGTF